MKKGRIGALTGAALISLSLAACGDGSESGTAYSSERVDEKPTQSKNNSSGGALTPPGTTLALGEVATVGWVPFTESTDYAKAHDGIKVAVTTEAIEKGDAGDLDGVELEDAPADPTPYYVRLTVEALESTEPPAEEEPDIQFDAIDDRGEEQESVIFFGDFEPCEEADMPRPFTDGASYETCRTFLVGGGGSIESVHWNDGPSEAHEVTPYFEEPVIWQNR